MEFKVGDIIKENRVVHSYLYKIEKVGYLNNRLQAMLINIETGEFLAWSYILQTFRLATEEEIAEVISKRINDGS